MITTIEGYNKDKLSKTAEELKRFYTVKNKRKVFLTSYALACGYKDLTYMPDGLGYHYIVMISGGWYETGNTAEYSMKHYHKTLASARKGL